VVPSSHFREQLVHSDHSDNLNEKHQGGGGFSEENLVFLRKTSGISGVKPVKPQKFRNSTMKTSGNMGKTINDRGFNL